MSSPLNGSMADPLSNPTTNNNESSETSDDDDDDNNRVNIVLNSSAAPRTALPRYQRKTHEQLLATNNSNNTATATANATNSDNKNNTTIQHPFLTHPNPIIYELDIDSIPDKKWRQPGVDITDFFNYGFNETTFKAYQQLQLNLRNGIDPNKVKQEQTVPSIPLLPPQQSTTAQQIQQQQSNYDQQFDNEDTYYNYNNNNQQYEPPAPPIFQQPYISSDPSARSHIQQYNNRPPPTHYNDRVPHGYTRDPYINDSYRGRYRGGRNDRNYSSHERYISPSAQTSPTVQSDTQSPTGNEYNQQQRPSINNRNYDRRQQRSRSPPPPPPQQQQRGRRR